MTTNSEPTIQSVLDKLSEMPKESPQRKELIQSLWYDWFCKESSLYNRGETLISRMNTLLRKLNIDTTKHYVFFKNSCPMVGSLFDEFKICNMEGDVLIYCAPKTGFDKHLENSITSIIVDFRNNDDGTEYQGESWHDAVNQLVENNT